MMVALREDGPEIASSEVKGELRSNADSQPTTIAVRSMQPELRIVTKLDGQRLWNSAEPVRLSSSRPRNIQSP